MPSAWCFSWSAGTPTRDDLAVSQRDADLQFGFELNWDVEFDFPFSSEFKSDFTCVSSCALALVLFGFELHFDVASSCELASVPFFLRLECDFGFFFLFSFVFDFAFAVVCCGVSPRPGRLRYVAPLSPGVCTSGRLLGPPVGRCTRTPFLGAVRLRAA